jgi:hypothetical protein
MRRESHVRFWESAGVRFLCATRLVRSIKEECLGRIIPLGGAALPTRDHGVCGALSLRTESPRTRQSADHGDARGRHGPPRASALAPGRTA